ncbi:MAG: hypothetical protein ACO1PZ_09655 [Gammaproteobacteria bacterium]
MNEYRSGRSTAPDQSTRSSRDAARLYEASHDICTDPALKPGGLYGIVDHTRRHNEPDSRENGRRVDPVLVIKEVQDSGFEFVDYGSFLRSPEDELVYEVGNPEVTGKTDRFALLFRKPE